MLYYIDMEALVGDPLQKEADQEVCVLFNHYGFTGMFGAAGTAIKNLKSGQAKMMRQLIEGEDYFRSSPQLEFRRHAEEETTGSSSRPEGESEAPSSKTPKSFAPGGKPQEPPKGGPSQGSKGDRRHSSADVGATAKARPAKAMPKAPEPKAMPTDAPRQPPHPPPPSRMQTGRDEQTTYVDDVDMTNDPGQSSQTPINPTKGGKGKGYRSGRKGS